VDGQGDQAAEEDELADEREDQELDRELAALVGVGDARRVRRRVGLRGRLRRVGRVGDGRAR
jgi:hypothetical protein